MRWITVANLVYTVHTNCSYGTALSMAFGLQITAYGPLSRQLAGLCKHLYIRNVTNWRLSDKKCNYQCSIRFYLSYPFFFLIISFPLTFSPSIAYKYINCNDIRSMSLGCNLKNTFLGVIPNKIIYFWADLLSIAPIIVEKLYHTSNVLQQR